MVHTNIEIIQALDRLRINNLYVHNTELAGVHFSTNKLKDRKVYLVETLAVINALVERGTMMLYGGHGGGKTTLSKYLGQIFCKLSKEEIENCILRGHPQLTEEKILGSLDFAQMLGKKELVNDKINVVWNEFVISKWKIIDEINRLSPYAQNILLSLLAEGSVKYHDQSKIVPPFTLYATLNPKDNANTELSLPFKDRFALALPITMPDYDSFSTIGKKDKLGRQDNLESYLQGVELAEIQEQVKAVPYSEDAELFINYIIASYRLCERASKESNDMISVDKNLCENCHMNAPEKVCCKIKQPLSVRVKEDLYRYGKALAWFLGDKEVNIAHILALSPYMIWHRSVLSKKYSSSLTEAWRETSSSKQIANFITNIDLDGTREIINRIYKEFQGVKHLLVKFEEVRTGQLSEKDFDLLVQDAQSPNYNSLIINAEILPVLQYKYSSVYGEIIKYNQKIDVTSNIEQLKQIKEEIAFKYNIPNRQYLSDKIERKIKSIAIQQKEFVLDKDDVLSCVELFNSISRVAPEIDLNICDLEKAKEYHVKDISTDECTLTVKFVRGKYKFTYKGEENTELFNYLLQHDVN
ncbi:MAG: MoxR family ATPase [Bacteroidales bacterium]|nr:MoxR family ATPase [Bacteroidales bacterium]